MKPLLLLALALSISPLVHAADPACRSLVMTGHPSYPPVAWASGGKIIGAAPTMVTDIVRTLGVTKITSKDFGTWEKAQEAARKGDVDIIFGIYRNTERETYLNYVEPPFMVDPVAVAVRTGTEFPFAEWTDLKGKKGVTNVGESYGTKFDAFMAKELTVAREQGVDNSFKALVNKKADFMIVGLYPGKQVARGLGIRAKVEFLPKEITAADMYVAFSKKSKCYDSLQAGLSAGIKTDVERGTVAELLQTASRAVVK